MGTTVVIATHNEALVQRFGYPRLHLSEGRLHTMPAAAEPAAAVGAGS